MRVATTRTRWALVVVVVLILGLGAGLALWSGRPQAPAVPVTVSGLTPWQQQYVFRPGQHLDLTGNHLEAVTHVSIGDDAATLTRSDEGGLRITIPAELESGRREVRLFADRGLVAEVPIHVAADDETGVLSHPVSVGPWASGHVQGIAVDEARGFIYLSMTDRLVKTDMRGSTVASIENIRGHLGDLALEESTGRVFGSLEYKAEDPANARFFLGVFDGPAMDETGMSVEDIRVARAIALPTVNDNFASGRWGTSGVDGVAFGPSWAHPDVNALTIAYGIFQSDTANNDQVLQQFEPGSWERYAVPFDQDALHVQGPSAPQTYTVRTGNSDFGVQNLEYDRMHGQWLLAVYPGTSPAWPNYRLFAVAAEAQVRTDGSLPLSAGALTDSATGVTGWDGQPGTLVASAATGLSSLPDGSFVVAASAYTPDGQFGATLTRACFESTAAEGFVSCESGAH